MKDKFTMILSMVAIVISLVSATVSIYQQDSSSKRAAREHLSVAVAKLIDLNTRNTMLQGTPPELRDAHFFQQSSTNSQTAASITRQAVFLVDQYPGVVTDVDYVSIAQGLMIVGDFELADQYMRTAIDKAPSDFYRVINLRGYGQFLFGQGRHEAGRKMYADALKIADNDTDFNKNTNGYTYQMWMASEAQNGFEQEAERYYQRAKSLFNSISIDPWRESTLKGLYHARGVYPSPSPGGPTHTD